MLVVAVAGTVAPGGYAWILPKKGCANVGLGVARRFSRMPVGDYFDQFLRMKNIKNAEPPMGKFVPMSGPISRTVIGDSLLVGDAAGQVIEYR